MGVNRVGVYGLRVTRVGVNRVGVNREGVNEDTRFCQHMRGKRKGWMDYGMDT